MMKKTMFLTGVLVATMVVSAVPSFALDKEVGIEFRRVEQKLARVTQSNEQLQKDVRQIQKKMGEVLKSYEELQAKYDNLLDATLKIENVDVANLRAGQKGLYEQITEFTWGEDTEDCDAIGAKHQQVEAVKSKDGSRTLRFLCYDGKTLHLSTEINESPVGTE